MSNVLAGLGVAGLAAGTLTRALGSSQKKNASQAAIEQERSRREGVAGQQAEITQGQLAALPGLGEAQGSAIQRLAQVMGPGSQQAYEQGVAGGQADIGAGLQFLREQSPLSIEAQVEPGVGAAGQARQNILSQLTPSTEANRQVTLSGLGRLAAGQEQAAGNRQYGLSMADIQRQLSGLQRQGAEQSAQIGLEDLRGALDFQQRIGQAQQVGTRTNAFGTLLQQLGGFGLGTLGG